MAVKKKAKAIHKTIQLKPDRLILAIAIALILAVIVSSAIIADNQRRTPQTVYDFGKAVAQGIDVSEHNGEIDWGVIADNYDFAFIRVGYRGYGNGELCEDKYAVKNLKAAEKAGIPFGVYFYTQAVSVKEAQAEADFVLDMIKHYDVALPVIIDFEYPVDEEGSNTGRLTEALLSADENTEIINAFCSRIEKKGYIPGVYASSWVMHNNLNLSELGDSTVIWTADYNDSITYDIDCDIWQYSKTGQEDGVSSKYVDLNYWYSK